MDSTVCVDVAKATAGAVMPTVLMVSSIQLCKIDYTTDARVVRVAGVGGSSLSAIPNPVASINHLEVAA